MTAEGPEPVVLPAGLRERVLEASRQARAAGQSIPPVMEISPTEAFSRAADAFDGLLCALSDDDWRRPVLRGLDVQGVVGHLIGVEDDVHRCLSGDPQVAGASHVESTQPAAERQAGRPAARTRTDWRRAADRTLDLVRAAGDPCAEVAVHGMRLPLSALLVVRAFELWTHDNDIRRAAGLPASVPDPSTLGLMTRLAARLLPYAAARTGLHEPVNVRLVLTGPGGGTWDIAVGEGPPDPVSIRIIADAVGFCRLVANRVTPADLDLHVTGDPGRATGVLAAASALALDLDRSPAAGDPRPIRATYPCWSCEPPSTRNSRSVRPFSTTGLQRPLTPSQKEERYASGEPPLRRGPSDRRRVRRRDDR